MNDQFIQGIIFDWNKIDDDSYKQLTKEQINELIDEAKNKNKVTYKSLIKILGIKNIKVKDLNLSKSEYIKVIDELKKKLNISKEEKIDIYSLDEENKKIYDDIYNEKLFSKTLIEFKGYNLLKKAITLSYNSGTWNDVKDNIDLMIAILLKICPISKII